MELNYKIFGKGEPLIILHGLFGMLDNWSTLARKFGAYYKVYIVDLRNHGKSPHHPQMDYATLAKDIETFLKTHQLQHVNLIGHSMGGKVAMQFAIEYPELLKQLIVVDIAPQAYKGNHTQIFEAFNNLSLPNIKSRKQADTALQDILPEFGVRQFILKNLARNTEGQYFWRPAVAYIHQNYLSILSAIEGIYNEPTLFIKGAQSNYIKDDDAVNIQKQFPKAKIKTIENAGHWVHAEQPAAFFDTVKQFLVE